MGLSDACKACISAAVCTRTSCIPHKLVKQALVVEAFVMVCSHTGADVGKSSRAQKSLAQQRSACCVTCCKFSLRTGSGHIAAPSLFHHVHLPCRGAAHAVLPLT